MQLRRIGSRHFAHPAAVALALGRLAGEDVALERRRPLDLAGAGLLEALRRAPVTLQLHLLHDGLAWSAGPSPGPPPQLCAAGSGLAAGAFGLGADPRLAVRIVCIWLPSCRGMVS